MVDIFKYCISCGSDNQYIGLLMDNLTFKQNGLSKSE